MFCVNIVNFFIPVSYYITEQNVYERRPVSYVYYAIILYYCLSGVLVTRRYKKENGTIAFFNINLFLLPILAGAGLQFMFYGLSLAWLSAAIGLVGLFMMQQNEMTYIDALTGIYNRQYLNHILSSWISRGEKFAGIMIDIDDFKRINDSFGHSEGDRTLIRVADILKRAQEEKEWVFRFAGDEFIVLKLTDSPEGLTSYEDRMNRLLDEYNRGNPPYPIRVSCGASAFDSGDMDSFMKAIDEEMYKMKADHHRHAAWQAESDVF